MKSGRFHVKSTQNLIKANVSTKPIQFDECRRGAMNQDFMKSWVIAPSLHPPPNWRVFVETSDFIRFWVDFTWNLPDFRWNPPDFCLGPIAWPMLGTCSSHSEAHAHLCPPNIKCTPQSTTAPHHLLYSMSTAINGFTNTPSKYNSIVYLYMRYGGSTELAPPMWQ